jgi:hypothetical protein
MPSGPFESLNVTIITGRWVFSPSSLHAIIAKYIRKGKDGLDEILDVVTRFTIKKDEI